LYIIDPADPKNVIVPNTEFEFGPGISPPLLTKDRIFVITSYLGGSIMRSFDFSGTEIWKWDTSSFSPTGIFSMSFGGVLFVPGQQLIAIFP